MKCQKCNNEISQNQKFCKYCGTPVNLNNEISSEAEQNNNVTNPNMGMQSNSNDINLNKEVEPSNNIINANMGIDQNNDTIKLNMEVEQNNNATNSNMSIKQNNYAMDRNKEVEPSNNVTNSNMGIQQNNNINPNQNSQAQNYNNNSNNYQNGNGQNSNYNSGYNTQGFNGQVSQNPVYPNNNNGNKSKKVPLIIGGAIAGFLILALIAVGVVSAIKSSAKLSENAIEKSLIGQKLELGDSKIVLDEDKVQSVTIKERETDEYSDTIEADLVIEEDGVKADIECRLYYSKNKSKWDLTTVSATNLNSVESDQTIEDAIKKDLLEQDTIYMGSYNSVYSSLIDEISNVKLSDEGLSYKEVDADISFTNGLYTANATATGSVNYNWDEKKWEVGYLTLEMDGQPKKNDKEDKDRMKKAIKCALDTDSIYISNTCKIGNKDKKSYGYITGNLVDEFQIEDYTLNTQDNLIIASVKGTMAKDIINKIEFKGTVSIPLEIGKDARSKVELSAESGSVEGPNSDTLQAIMIDEDVSGKKIDMTAAKTFTETKRNTQPIIGQLIYGTMAINGATVEVQIGVELSSDKEENLVWKVDRIVKKGDYSFIEY